jgi:hypothetical protein
MVESVAPTEEAAEPESEPELVVTWRDPQNRFTASTSQAFSELHTELWSFGRRLSHIRSLHAELVHVGRSKPFEIRHEPAWIMALSERDMIVVDLASWVKALYSRGGFLKLLQGSDLQALGWSWKPTELKGDVGSLAKTIDREFVRRQCDARREAFDRLFPGAKKNTPSRQDVEGLEGRLCQQFEPLLDDRDKHRAHKYERDSKNATAAMLAPDEIATHLEACQKLLADLRLLSSNSSFNAYGYDPKVHENDEHARDIVDLILCGPILWIIEFGPNVGVKLDDKTYWQRRNTYYERLHADHEARGKPAEPFNAIRTGDT